MYPRKESPEFNSHADHRIAMAMAVVIAVAGNGSLAGKEAVAKSFPGFLPNSLKLLTELAKMTDR